MSERQDIPVTAHPAVFPHQHESSHHRRPSSTAPSSSPAPIQLPRTLARPQFTDISRDALAAAAPELAGSGVPAEFVRHGLRAKAPAMLGGIGSLAQSHIPQALPRSRLPATLSVPLRNNAAGLALPTHALAVSKAGKSGTDEDAPTTVYPVHAVVLAAHCTKLPRMPRSSPASQSHVTLPVLPLPLPSLPAFAIIHSWLYTTRIDAVLSSLLPHALPAPILERLASSPSEADALRVLEDTMASRQAVHALATHLCAASSGNLGVLMGHAGHVKELWTDVVALGICDPGMWGAIDLAWEVVLGAMNLAAAQ